MPHPLILQGLVQPPGGQQGVVNVLDAQVLQVPLRMKLVTGSNTSSGGGGGSAGAGVATSTAAAAAAEHSHTAEPAASFPSTGTPEKW